MCKTDHRNIIHNTITSLVEDGGGSVVCRCGECSRRFLVSYGGPVGLFMDVKELGVGKYE